MKKIALFVPVLIAVPLALAVACDGGPADTDGMAGDGSGGTDPSGGTSNDGSGGSTGGSTPTGGTGGQATGGLGGLGGFGGYGGLGGFGGGGPTVEELATTRCTTTAALSCGETLEECVDLIATRRGYLPEVPECEDINYAIVECEAGWDASYFTCGPAPDYDHEAQLTDYADCGTLHDDFWVCYGIYAYD